MSVIVAPDELRRLSERQRVSGYGRGAPLPYGAGCGNDVARGVEGEPGSRARPMRAVQVGEGGRGSRGELRVAPLSAHVNETPPWCGCRILLGPASSPHNDAVLVWRVAIAAVAVQHHIARVMPVALRHDLIERRAFNTPDVLPGVQVEFAPEGTCVVQAIALDTLLSEEEGRAHQEAMSARARGPVFADGLIRPRLRRSLARPVLTHVVAGARAADGGS